MGKHEYKYIIKFVKNVKLLLKEQLIVLYIIELCYKWGKIMLNFLKNDTRDIRKIKRKIKER